MGRPLRGKCEQGKVDSHRITKANSGGDTGGEKRNEMKKKS